MRTALEVLKLLSDNIRWRWREWRDPRILVGETLQEEVVNHVRRTGT